MNNPNNRQRNAFVSDVLSSRSGQVEARERTTDCVHTLTYGFVLCERFHDNQFPTTSGVT